MPVGMRTLLVLELVIVSANAVQVNPEQSTIEGGGSPPQPLSFKVDTRSNVSTDPHQAGGAPSEKDLHDLWASGYEGWIDAPGEAKGTIFFRPHKQGLSSSPGNKDLPKLFKENKDAVLFSLTAYNPLGVQLAKHENLSRNQQLAQDLQQMEPQPLYKWRSFGFSKDWREDGFTMAFSAGYAQTAQVKVVDMAKQFKQGGIYKFFLQDGKLMRETIPAAFTSNTVAETVTLVRADKPPVVPGP